MRPRFVFVLGSLVLGTPAAAVAQILVGTAVLEGSALDSASGRGVDRGYVCAMIGERAAGYGERCVGVDADGGYIIHGLPAGRWRFEVRCTKSDCELRALADGDVALVDDASVRRVWVVSTSGCDPRPLRRVTETLRGYWTLGFESSRFVPCAEDAWFVPGDSLRTEPYDQRFAWAWMRKDALPRDFEGSRPAGDLHASATYFVHWRGTITGPGFYGHLGGYPFQIEVDSLLAIRAPRPDDCEAIR